VALQQGGVYWAHQDPVNKSQRLTDTNGNIAAAIELDPWGSETNRSWNNHLQPHRFTSYERNSTGDESLFRRYHVWWSRFAHPDPYDGSYNLSDPQSFNRYSYVENDPVNFVDPTGLDDCSGEFNATGGCTIGDGGPGGIDAGHLRFLLEALTRSAGSFGGGDVGGDGDRGDGGGRRGGGASDQEPSKPSFQETRNPSKRSVDDCIDDAIRMYLGSQAQAAILGYASWTGMGFLTLGLISTRGGPAAGLEAYHLTEGRSRIAAAYIPLTLGVAASVRQHRVNFGAYQGAVRACRSQ
jgi:RHS repeat-associated protein